MGKQPTIEFVCPDGHDQVIDEEKSNENWKVQSANCPECGKQLIPKVSNG